MVGSRLAPNELIDPLGWSFPCSRGALYTFPRPPQARPCPTQLSGLPLLLTDRALLQDPVDYRRQPRLRWAGAWPDLFAFLERQRRIY